MLGSQTQVLNPSFTGAYILKRILTTVLHYLLKAPPYRCSNLPRVYFPVLQLELKLTWLCEMCMAFSAKLCRESTNQSVEQNIGRKHAHVFKCLPFIELDVGQGMCIFPWNTYVVIWDLQPMYLNVASHHLYWSPLQGLPCALQMQPLKSLGSVLTITSIKSHFSVKYSAMQNKWD